jgi:hypothetical protein
MMDYKGMAQRLGQFRQAQVPGGGQRPLNGWHDRMQGVGNKLQGAFGGIMNGLPQGQVMPQQGMQFNNPIQGWNRPPAQAPMGQMPMRQMPMMRPRNGNMGGGGSFGG